MKTALSVIYQIQEETGMKTVIDLVLLAIIIACVWAGYKKGLIMGIAGMLAIVVSLYGATLISTAYSYEMVPALRPFVSGYVEHQTRDVVLEEMNLSDTQLSTEDLLARDPTLRHEFCMRAYTSVGIYSDVADQLATEAELKALEQELSIEDAIVETLCERLCYVAIVVLAFLIILIALTALMNLPNLSFKIPNMDTLNDALGAVVGLLTGLVFCVLLCWALQFLGLLIGQDTLEKTVLGRFFLSIDFITKGIGI